MISNSIDKKDDNNLKKERTLNGSDEKLILSFNSSNNIE